ncbi:MAG: hypothetical protein OEU54_00115 [Gemmatimonadota bacterium]|nr:hypothetical protein [Gemmatimonadota bacterium]
MSRNWSVPAKRWGGGALIGVAAFMFLGFMVSGGAFSTAATVAAFLVSVVLPATTGGLMIKSSMGGGRALTERQEALRLETIQAEVLRLAGVHGGRLTVVEVAGELGIPASTAEEVLNELMAKEVSDVAVTESGLLVYEFHDLKHLSEKEDARGILDAGPDRGFDVESGLDRPGMNRPDEAD